MCGFLLNVISLVETPLLLQDEPGSTPTCPMTSITLPLCFNTIASSPLNESSEDTRLAASVKVEFAPL